MTAAAKAFAARFDKPTDKTAGNKHDHNRSTDGNSLAERLDKLSVSKQKNLTIDHTTQAVLNWKHQDKIKVWWPQKRINRRRRKKRRNCSRCWRS